MLGLIEPGHLIPILIVALLIFGPRRLPELGKSLGGAIRSFRQGAHGLAEDFSEATRTPAPEAVRAEPVPVQTLVAVAAPTSPVTSGPARPAETE